MKKQILLLILCSCSAHLAFSQNTTDTTTKKLSVFPLPVVYYTPETRLAYGAVALFTFRFSDDTNSRNSQIETGIAHTQNNQLLFYVPYQLYTNQNKFYFFGELRYYRYSYNFYGVGNDVPLDFVETYKVNIPRLRINATKLIGKHTYAGLRYWFDDFNMQSVEEDGRLINATVTGSKGGIISALGAVLIRDSRDNYNYPSKGSFTELLALPSLHSFGSEYEFSRLSADYVKYFSLGKSTILAANAYVESNIGTVPFNEMAFIGGRYKMRGYYEGRFRDKHLALSQLEIRQWIKGRFGAVAFGGVAAVTNNFDTFQIKHSRFSGGIGLRYRLDRDDKVNIRLDYGFGAHGSRGLYLTFNEAF